MKKVCFIVPYFGKFPNYFQLFLNSCEYNSNYDWLLITDDKSNFDYPKNVKRVLMSFKDLQEKIQSKFDFKISLAAPYKLCDFKPAYGYLFEECLSDYDYWGFCDLDIMLGNLDHFLPKILNYNYDKIFTLGHFQLYKNDKVNNRIFMSSINGETLYKKAFSTDKVLVFDETRGDNLSVNDIFVHKGKKIYQDDPSFNIKVTPTRFTQVKFDYSSGSFNTMPTPYQMIIFCYKKGLYTCYSNNGCLVFKEFLYAHLQQRRMKLIGINKKNKVIAIVPNAFYGLQKIPKTVKQFDSLRKRNFNLHKIRIVLKWRFLRLKRLFNKGD